MHKNYTIFTRKEISKMLALANKNEDNVVVFTCSTPIGDGKFIIPQNDSFRNIVNFNDLDLEDITDYEKF